MMQGDGLGRYPEYWAAYNICWRYRAAIYARGEQWHDLIIDVYIKLLEWNSYDPTKGNVWIYHYFGARFAILSWIAHKDVRKRKLSGYRLPTYEIPDTTLEIDDKEEIRKIMGIIPKRELKLILEYFDKGKYRSVGEKNNLSHERVRQLVHRGINIARSHYGLCKTIETESQTTTRDRRQVS